MDSSVKSAIVVSGVVMPEMDGPTLLIEDEEGLRALDARGLSPRGYTVLEAANGVEASSRAR